MRVWLFNQIIRYVFRGIPISFPSSNISQDGIYVILLEYMNLGSLDRVMKQVKNIPEVILGFITFKILKGLAYLHGNKIIHRDIKPGNVLLNDKGDVKIADFGMSRQLENNNELVESYVGTMLYMTSERLTGDKYTATTDLWSLGISIIELATGKNPYRKYFLYHKLFTF